MARSGRDKANHLENSLIEGMPPREFGTVDDEPASVEPLSNKRSPRAVRSGSETVKPGTFSAGPDIPVVRRRRQVPTETRSPGTETARASGTAETASSTTPGSLTPETFVYPEGFEYGAISTQIAASLTSWRAELHDAPDLSQALDLILRLHPLSAVNLPESRHPFRVKPKNMAEVCELIVRSKNLIAEDRLRIGDITQYVSELSTVSDRIAASETTEWEQ